MTTKTNSPKILIVDDIPQNIQIAANILKKGNFNISFAVDGVMALSKIEKVKFDLILLDVMMPELDGFEVCRLLKANPETSDIPVVFLTAKAEVESMVTGFEIGGADYITKPFNSIELLARVKTHISIKQKSDLLKKATATTNKLFSIIAHDLRGLMGNVKNIFEILTNKDYSFDQERVNNFLKAGKESSASTYNLLENLLCWTRNKEGNMISRARLQTVELLIKEVTDLFSATLSNKSVKLHVHDFDYTLIAYFDEDMLRTILRNLISNAIKFTPVGGEINLSIKQNKKKKELILEVNDSGVGMSEATIAKIKNKEFSLILEGPSDGKGTGLGLPLVFSFVEQLNAKLEIESEVGRGTTFSLYLPTIEPIGELKFM